MAAAVTVFTGALFSSIGWTAHDRTIDMVNDGFDGVIRISGVATNAKVGMIENLSQTGNQGIQVVAGLLVTIALVKFRAYLAKLQAPDDYREWDLVLDTPSTPMPMLEAAPSDNTLNHDIVRSVREGIPTGSTYKGIYAQCSDDTRRNALRWARTRNFAFTKTQDEPNHYCWTAPGDSATPQTHLVRQLKTSYAITA